MPKVICIMGAITPKEHWWNFKQYLILIFIFCVFGIPFPSLGRAKIITVQFRESYVYKWEKKGKANTDVWTPEVGSGAHIHLQTYKHTHTHYWLVKLYKQAFNWEREKGHFHVTQSVYRTPKPTTHISNNYAFYFHYYINVFEQLHMYLFYTNIIFTHTGP